MSNKIYNYKTLSSYSEATIKEKGSRFIACAKAIRSLEEFKYFLEEIKNKYPAAVHYCYAYRIGIKNLLFRANDDGEPSGSAGKPIYNQLLAKELDNVAVIVVRYFGGTLLGVPGLIHAYKTSTEETIKNNTIVIEEISNRVELRFDYLKMNDVMKLIKRYNIDIINQNSEMDCNMLLEYSIKNEEQIIKYLEEAEIEFQLISA